MNRIFPYKITIKSSRDRIKDNDPPLKSYSPILFLIPLKFQIPNTSKYTYPPRLDLDYIGSRCGYRDQQRNERREGKGRQDLRKGPRSVHVPCTRLDYDQQPRTAEGGREGGRELERGDR